MYNDRLNHIKIKARKMLHINITSVQKIGMGEIAWVDIKLRGCKLSMQRRRHKKEFTFTHNRLAHIIFYNIEF